MIPIRRAILFTFFLGALQALADETDGPPPPNVLFIITDDLNCDIGPYGHPIVQTPHLDRLARRGLTFERAYTNFPVCAQSRASIMTGLYPAQNGVTKLWRLFRDYVPDAVTLTQHFQRHGYTTARVGKLYHYGNPRGIGTNGHDDAASWDVRVSPIGRDKAEEDKIFSLRPGSFGASLSWLAAEGTDEEQTDGKVATESIRALQHFASTGEPFFLGVGFYKPHTPFVAPQRYFDLYDPNDIEIPTVPAGYLDTLPEPAAKSIRRRTTEIDLPDATARKAIHAYYATTSFLDAQIGRVLTALDELGLSNNTIVLFTSDHGYHLGEHGYYQKTTLFEASARVPLIVATPTQMARGKRTTALVEMIDFYQTLSELAGLNAPQPYIQGHSFAPLLDNPDGKGRPSAITQLENGFSLRTSRYRFSQWQDAGDDAIELYDHETDPAEMVNLAGDPAYAAIRTELEVQLEQRITEITTPVPGLRFIPPTAEDRGYSIEAIKAHHTADEAVIHTFPAALGPVP